MHKILEEFSHPDGAARGFRFRIGRTLASALAGFIVGALGTAFYFWYVFSKLWPIYCGQ